jgi:hypothetical protein
VRHCGKKKYILLPQKPNQQHNQTNQKHEDGDAVDAVHHFQIKSVVALFKQGSWI